MQYLQLVRLSDVIPLDDVAHADQRTIINFIFYFPFRCATIHYISLYI